MKTFHYSLGHAALTLLTVGELIDKLLNHPRDMPVAATWEGQVMPLGHLMTGDSFHSGKPEEACEILLVDAEWGGSNV